MIYLRRARLADVAAILAIVEEARKFLSGFETDQWQGAYPAQTDLERFIKAEVGQVLIVGGEIAGFSALILGEDKAYTDITDGSWANERLDYAAIHCIALSDKHRGQGLASTLFSCLFTLGLERGIKDFRVDTHPNNKIMQRVFDREGFAYRGRVILSDGLRLAYQLELCVE